MEISNRRLAFALVAFGLAAGCTPSSGMTNGTGAGGIAGDGSGSGGTGAGGSGAGTAGSGSAGSGTAGSGSAGSGTAGVSGGGASGGQAGAGPTGAAGAAGRGGAGSGGTTTTGTAGAVGSAGRGGSSGGGSLAITGLRIEANPKNVLSAFVSWSTAEAATSVVQFGVANYEWEMADTAMVTSHRVVVIGMRASQAYRIKAMSSNAGGSGSVEGMFTTGALPASIPVATISSVDKARMQPGWTLMNIQKGDGSVSARSRTPAQAVIYDADGQPIWYHINGTSVDRGGAISVDLTDKGVLFGAVLNDSLQNGEPPREVDFAGNTIWQCSTPNCGGSGNLTHHVNKLPNGHYLLQRDVTSSGGTAPVFEEITADGMIVWTLDYARLVTKPSGLSGDWCHGNSITLNIDRNEVYANCRFMGLIKTTYQNPTLRWHLPASYNGRNVAGMRFSPTTSQYSDTHAPDINADGTILFFDNGGYSGVSEEGNPRNYQSRAVEYRIDETANTATLVWEFPGTFAVDTWYTTQFYVPFWGDADRLANGNVLVTAGRRGTTVRSRIFEVGKQDGKVVWEFQLPIDYGVYRSERLSPPPLVRPVTQ
jgi:hypothetical protein